MVKSSKKSKSTPSLVKDKDGGPTKNLSFQVGDRVFAQGKGHLPWPAKILLQFQEDPNKLVVQYYGTYDSERVSADKLYPYNKETLKKFGNADPRRAPHLFEMALREISENKRGDLKPTTRRRAPRVEVKVKAKAAKAKARSLKVEVEESQSEMEPGVEEEEEEEAPVENEPELDSESESDSDAESTMETEDETEVEESPAPGPSKSGENLARNFKSPGKKLKVDDDQVDEPVAPSPSKSKKIKVEQMQDESDTEQEPEVNPKRKNLKKDSKSAKSSASDKTETKAKGNLKLKEKKTGQDGESSLQTKEKQGPRRSLRRKAK